MSDRIREGFFIEPVDEFENARNKSVLIREVIDDMLNNTEFIELITFKKNKVKKKVYVIEITKDMKKKLVKLTKKTKKKQSILLNEYLKYIGYYD